MWCPKCKTEYREGIKVCADCGTELVEESQTIEVDMCELSDEKVAKELLEFLDYSGIKTAKMEPSEDKKSYRVIVAEEDKEAADKIIHGYLLAKSEEKEERAEEENTDNNQETASDSEYSANANEDKQEVTSENNELEDDTLSTDDITKENVSDDEDDALLITDEIKEDTIDLLYTSDKKDYVKKSDLYRDTKFSGITFLVFGIVGGIYLTLCKTKILPIQYNIVVFVIIAALFGGFIIAGIVSMVKSRKIKSLIPEEEALTNEIKDLLKEHITHELTESWIDSSISEVENDLLITAHIRSELSKQYPELQKEYIEMIADEYFEENFLQED